MADIEISLSDAQNQTSERIRNFIDNPRRPYLPLWSAIGGGEISERALVTVAAAQVATGVGKTTEIVREVASCVRKMRERGDNQKIALLVPRHQLGEQIALELRTANVTVTVFRGREAKDPICPDALMCRDTEAVKVAQSVGEPVQTSCCRSEDGTKVCPYFDTCGYQRQMRSSPDVWIAAHQYLNQDPQMFGDVAFVFIDEQFWRSVLSPLRIYKGQVREKGLTYGEIDGLAGSSMPTETAKCQLVSALRAHPRPESPTPDGLIAIDPTVLRCAGLSPEACRAVAMAEMHSSEQVRLYPGMPPVERSKAIRAVARNKALAGRCARLWEALAELLEQPYGVQSGRVFLRAGDGSILVQGGPNIHDGWRDIPTMMLDATLPPRDLLNWFFPRHQVIRQEVGITNVEMPLTRVRQVINAPVSGNKLDVEQNCESLLSYILRQWHETGRAETLVVAQKKLADWLKLNLPPEIKVWHFNNLAGMNGGGGVRLLLVVGRPLPGTREVELLAGAMTGAMPNPAPQSGNGQRWYQRKVRIAALKGGGEGHFNVYHHPDPVAEAVRQQICEGEVMQAIGRARAVRRGQTGKALDIHILADLELPIPVHEFALWDQVKVGRELAMIQAGCILESAADIASSWPEIWETRDAAKGWLKRVLTAAPVSGSAPLYEFICKGSDPEMVHDWIAIRYKPVGQGQQWRCAHYNPSLISDPHEWLESRLGMKLSGFEVVP